MFWLRRHFPTNAHPRPAQIGVVCKSYAILRLTTAECSTARESLTPVISMRYLGPLLLTMLLGCDSAARTSEDSRANVATAGGERLQASASLSQVEVTPAQPPAPVVSLDSAAVQPAATPAMLIRTGRAVIEVDSLEHAIAAVRQIALRVGGWVATSSVEGGVDRLGSASLELKIPASRWAEVIRGLEPVGRVESVVEEVQDVGEEFVDVDARLTNARRLQARLLELLDRRTGKLEDVLAVERELARVREEIERYEGRLRFLRTRVATSTLVVFLHEPSPLVGSPGENVLTNAFRDAWRNFIRFLAWTIAASGIIIPLALLAGLAVLATLRVRRGLRTQEKPEAP